MSVSSVPLDAEARDVWRDGSRRIVSSSTSSRAISPRAIAAPRAAAPLLRGPVDGSLPSPFGHLISTQTTSSGMIEAGIAHCGKYGGACCFHLRLAPEIRISDGPACRRSDSERTLCNRRIRLDDP